MKLIGVVVFFILAAVSLAQNILIGAPKPGAKVHAGRSLHVLIGKPDTLTDSPDIALVIAVAPCIGFPSHHCLPPQEALGTVLYNGTFNPQFERSGPFYPYQNFSVIIPHDFPKGPAQLNVANFELIGAEYFPDLQLLNTTITVY
ncbi:hypothetical protein APHAL10511_002293 [Amanita phalloides]|nr:hypothetical protein APHAL10511_002293 [Amanita phalloides]